MPNGNFCDPQSDFEDNEAVLVSDVLNRKESNCLYFYDFGKN